VEPINRHAALIAPHARRWLEAANEARVLHVFERVCNLVDDRGEVVSLVSSPLGPDPLAIRLGDAVDFTGLVEADSVVTIAPTQISVDALQIDLSTAKDWNPRPDWESAHRLFDAVRAILPRITAVMRQQAPADSFAALVVGNASGAGVYPGGQMQAIAAARGPARRLVDGLLAGDESACLDAAEKLAGLGSGLTPSGDDFIVGALHALYVLRPADAAALAAAIAARAAPRTTRLSAAWLHAAARGEAGSLWHGLIDALTVSDVATIEAGVSEVLQVGHTSGADALAGFVAVLGG